MLWVITLFLKGKCIKFVSYLYKKTHTHMTLTPHHGPISLPQRKFTHLIKGSVFNIKPYGLLLEVKYTLFHYHIFKCYLNFPYLQLMMALEVIRNGRIRMIDISFSELITTSVSNITNSTGNMNSPTLISISLTIPLGILETTSQLKDYLCRFELP